MRPSVLFFVAGAKYRPGDPLKAQSSEWGAPLLFFEDRQQAEHLVQLANGYLLVIDSAVVPGLEFDRAWVTRMNVPPHAILAIWRPELVP